MLDRKSCRRAVAAGTMLFALCAAAPKAQPPAPTPEGIAFFETKIRPILVANCYECHTVPFEDLVKPRVAARKDFRIGHHSIIIRCGI